MMKNKLLLENLSESSSILNPNIFNNLGFDESIVESLKTSVQTSLIAAVTPNKINDSIADEARNCAESLIKLDGGINYDAVLEESKNSTNKSDKNNNENWNYLTIDGYANLAIEQV